MHAFLDAVGWLTGAATVLFWLAALVVRKVQGKLVRVDAATLVVDGRMCLRWTLPDGTPVLRELPGVEGIPPGPVRVFCRADGRGAFHVGSPVDHAHPLRVAAGLFLAGFLASHVASLAVLLETAA